MKTGIIESPAITSEGLKGSLMSMSAKGMEHAAYFMRDRVYTDKILAVVREYICNAVDEHRKYKITKPIDVKLENVDGKYVWSVRDYALGLSEHSVRNVFGQYFESTKSGDNESVGGFGIGSKSGHSYGDTFYVTSYFEGIKTLYACILGGGTSGIPVGQIYAMSSEPTGETGICISVDVEPNSLHTFNNKCVAFVKSFSNDVTIHYKHNQDIHTQIAPEKSIQLEEFTLHKMGRDFVTTCNEYGTGAYFRMGGVVYSKRRFSHAPSLDNDGASYVIDMPIGSVTLPITRESIENTPSNDKVFARVEELIKDLYNTEKALATIPIAKGYLLLSAERSRTFTIDWFQYGVQEMYPELWNFTRLVSRSAWMDIAPTATGDYIIYLIPDISLSGKDKWKTRLDTHLKTLGITGFLYATNTDQFKELYDSDKIDMSNVLLIDVKKMGLPKLVTNGDSGAYLVYKYGRKVGTFSPDGLEDQVEEYNNTNNEEGWHENVTTMNDLNNRTISLVSDYGSGVAWFSANSKKLVESMKTDHNWLSPASAEYIAAKDRINAEILKERNAQNAESNIKSNFLYCGTNKLVVKAIGKDPDKLNRLVEAKKKIMGENSFRSRILRTMSYNYGITREDIRKILTMKG